MWGFLLSENQFVNKRTGFWVFFSVFEINRYLEVEGRVIYLFL